MIIHSLLLLEGGQEYETQTIFRIFCTVNEDPPESPMFYKSVIPWKINTIRLGVHFLEY